MKKWISLIILLAGAAGIFAGCSEQNAASEFMEDLVMPTEELTLSYAYWFEDRDLKQRVMEFESLYPNIKIELHYYDTDSEQYGDHLRTALQSGLGEDILQINFKEYFQFGNSVYLCDLYQFMDKDPAFRQENYYTNIFKAQEFNGRMPFFPRAFPISYVGVNSKYPGAVQQFEMLDIVTDEDMLDIYNSLPDMEKENLYLSPEYSITQVVYATEFMDFKNQTWNYKNQRFYDKATQALEGLPPGRDGMGATAVAYDYAMYEETEYLFAPIRSNDIKSFLPQKPPYTNFSQQHRPPEKHVDFKPRGDSQGNILINSTRNYSINGNSTAHNQTAAWEFIKYMVEMPEVSYENAVVRTYTDRNLNRTTMLDSYTALFQSETGREPDEAETAELEAIVDLLAETAGKAGVYHEAVYFKDINDICAQMIKGELTVAQGAERLESVIGIYMKE